MRIRPLLTLVALAAALPLTAPRAQDAAPSAVEAARRHVAEQALASGAARADVADLAVTYAYTDPQTGLTHVYLRQRLDGVPVPEGSVTVALGRDGRVLHVAGTVVAGLEAAQTRQPALSPADAAARVASLVGLGSAAFAVTETSADADRYTLLSDGGVARGPVSAELVYRRPDADGDGTPEGALRLAWEVNLYQRDAQHSWVVAVDAATGAELHRYDLVAHDDWGPPVTLQEMARTQADLGPWLFRPANASVPAATVAGGQFVGAYRVYGMPIESPNHTTPLPPADGRTLIPNPDVAGGMASPFGWHDTNGTAGAEFTTTQGNNVHAYTDVDANNTPDAGSSPNGGAGLSFDFPLDLTLAPSGYRPAAVTNLFYWNNIMHDVWAQYGFNQASGNFQQTNYGGGGFAGDYVRAEAQDGSSTNNANFCTPPEGGDIGCGTEPRMQMFIWTDPTPDKDGDLDNGIIAHEYGHGINHRLVGGPAVECFQNAERADEGLADWYGLMLTMRNTHTRTTNRGVGTYALNQPTNGPGIRPAPYNTDFAVNDYTYQDTRTLAVPHGVGFVYTTILWEATWDMIDAHGFSTDFYNASGTAGNQIMMRLVINGLKLTPCNPGFVDMRNAVLAADAALYPDPANPGQGLHYATLWTAFARRGLGFSASQGSTGSNADNTEAFDAPLPAAVASIAPLSVSAGLAVGATTTRTVTVANTAAAGSQTLTYAASIQNATEPAAPPAPAPSGALAVANAEALKGRDNTAGTGPPALAGGGPDAFGYTWKDSNEPGGPAVAFQDIAATGTPIATWTATGTFDPRDEGYADIALPFAFPFYGTPRNSIRVNTNGLLHFSTFATNSFTNAAIPTAATPNSLIAPFWDDLDMTAAGTVYTGTLPDGRFVVQYTGARLFNQAASALTFQVLLSDDGTIEYQYATMTPGGGTLNGATVGIENDGGTGGLQVAFNAAYVASNKAVRFTAPPTWVTVSPASGNVAPGGSANLTVTFDADGLTPGLYTADLVVTTNAPAAPTTTVPVTLQVGGVTLAGQAGWRMMAAPVAGMTVADLASQNLVQGIPGYYPTAGANLLTGYTGSGWTAPAGGATALTSGRGFLWYLYDETFNPGGPSQSVELPMTLSAPAAATEPTSNVAVTLHTAGNRWNLVGNPFLSGLNVAGLASWATGGTVQATGQVWDPNEGALGSYVLTSDPTMGNAVASWQGFFVENNTATGLTIPTSAKVDAGTFQGRTESHVLAFELEGATPDGAPVIDRALALHFGDGAADGWDLWDATKLTPLADAYALLAFAGERDGEAVLKAQESRALAPASFEVPLAFAAVGTGTAFTLRWPALAALPAAWTLTLRDVATGAVVDLRAAQSYTFTAVPTDAEAPAGVRAPAAVALDAGRAATRFVLAVTTSATTANEGAGAPVAFALAEPSPNPSAGAVALRYDAPAAGALRLEVFDLLGRRVATLVDGPVAAGRHVARWEAGSASAGVYVVRMTAGDFVQARRLTVVR